MSIVVGITGSIAVGKSTVTNYLLVHGYHVEDADKISHEALLQGSSVYSSLVEVFGCVDSEGNIDRKQLGQIVFNDASKKKALEDIVHPYVIKRMKEAIKECKDEIIFLDIPLLFEAHLEYLCDKIMVVYCDEQTQMQRLMNRNNINEDEALHLMHQQISIEEKKLKADYVVNNYNYQDLYQDIERVIKEIKDETIHE